MIDIVKKRVIDWDNQLRKEKHFNEKFGTNLSPSSVKELTGSFRRLTEKVNQKLEMEPYNNVRNFIFL